MRLLNLPRCAARALLRTLTSVCLCLGLLACASGGPGAVTAADYARENVRIRTDQVPDADRWQRATRQYGLGEVRPLVPSFDGQGLLMASWTPSAQPDAPTYVIAHGGGGMGGMLLFMAAELRARRQAQVLILDSLWSRGRRNNGGESIATAGPTISSNVRMFDLVAAGRWLAQQGVRPENTYVIGESQGGWGVLRAFTDEPQIRAWMQAYYAKGIALYPVCASTLENIYTVHPLGPYHSPVLLVTAGLDTLTPVSQCPAVTTQSASQWLHWDDVTHAFNIETHGLFVPPVDGVCQQMRNISGVHRFCHHARRTAQLMDEILKFTTP